MWSVDYNKCSSEYDIKTQFCWFECDEKTDLVLLTLQDLLHMLHSDCCVLVDTVLDLKDAKQVTLQKYFMVPLMSTTAMMRSNSCVIALKENQEGR